MIWTIARDAQLVRYFEYENIWSKKWELVALEFIRFWLEGLSFQLSVALISGLKGGAVVGVAVIMIFAIGEPRRRPPGGRR